MSELPKRWKDKLPQDWDSMDEDAKDKWIYQRLLLEISENQVDISRLLLLIQTLMQMPSESALAVLQKLLLSVNSQAEFVAAQVSETTTELMELKAEG
jgi:hypothetical protein